MDADERDIFRFLKSWGGQFVSMREICRRAGNKRRFQEEPDWARQVLLRMVGRGILESNPAGHFHIKRMSNKDKNKLWVEPDIAKVLEENGESPGENSEKAEEDTGDVASDEYYDQL